MRTVLIALAMASLSAQASPHVSKRIEPCAAEKQAMESANDTIAASITKIMELRTALGSDKESHEQILLPNLKDAEGRLLGANQTLLQETQILQMLNSSRVQLERLGQSLPRLAAFSELPQQPSTALAIHQILEARKTALDSEAVSDVQALVQVIRTLEKSSRTWRATVGNEPPQSLSQALEHVEVTHANLNQTVGNGPSTMSENRRKITEAQNAINNSLSVQRDKEAQLSDLERRLVLLRQNLPSLRTSLNACTRRAQFGE